MPAHSDGAIAGATSDDAFLGGRLSLRQPRRGHRSGIEAVLIAAAAPLGPGELVLDIGAGVGAAGLCALARVPGSRAVLVEADETLSALARGNAERNGLAGSVDIVVCDVARAGAAARAGLSETADHALANPPFHDPLTSRTAAEKTRAHAAPPDALDLWVRFAAAAVKPGGTLTVIHRAEALAAVLAAFSRRFGAAAVLPLHSRPGRPASRVIVQGRKGRRGALTLLPGRVLHEAAGNHFTAEIEAVLRDAAGLALAEPQTPSHL